MSMNGQMDRIEQTYNPPKGSLISRGLIISVFRVTGPYLNILVKPRIFFRFSGKSTILCILKGEMPSKMHKIIFFPDKKCVPTLPKDFRPVTQNTYFFIWPKWRTHLRVRIPRSR